MFQYGVSRGSLVLLIAASFSAACGGGTGSGFGSVPTQPSSNSSAASTSVETTSSIAPSTSAERSASPQPFSERGPFAVGVVNMQLDDSRSVIVFYPVDSEALPADAISFSYTAADMWGTASDVWPLGWATSVPDAWLDAPASMSGPFPLVVFSHGWGNTRFNNSLHTAHLASWGFVVAAPEHVSRDITARLAGQDTLPPSDLATIADTIRLMGTEGSLSGSALYDAIAIDQIAVEGYSAGGRDATLAATLPEVDTWISAAGTPPVPDDAVAVGELFAPAAGFDLDEYLAGKAPPDKPSMLLVAGADSVVDPSYSQSVYAWLAAPKRFVVLSNTGHVVFMDGCRLYQHGRLPGLVETYGLDPSSESVQIANNGCLPEFSPAENVAALWNHLVAAQLSWVFDLKADVAAASLERDYLDATFPGLLQEYVVVD